MAGNYPDVPNNRIAFDIDGSTGFYMNTSNAVTEMSPAQLALANKESAGGHGWIPYGGGGYMGIVFPRLMNISGIHVNYAPQVGTPTSHSMAMSTNTTNGFDGTWTAVGGYTVLGGVGPPSYRTQIAGITVSAARAIRIYGGMPDGWACYFQHCHLYGQPVAGQSSDRLEAWKPTLDQRVDPAYFDWGWAARSSTLDKQFRVKNHSATKSANNVVLTFTAPYDTSPSVAAQHYFSSDGVNFYGTLTIPSIGPGAASNVYYVRRVTPSTATLGLWTARIVMTPGSWT